MADETSPEETKPATDSPAIPQAPAEAADSTPAKTASTEAVAPSETGSAGDSAGASESPTAAVKIPPTTTDPAEITGGTEAGEAEPPVSAEGDEIVLTLEGAAPPDEIEIVKPPTIRGKIDPKTGAAIGTGRRKTSVARVRIVDGKGVLTINDRELGEYFKTDRDRQDVLAPLRATGTESEVNVWVRVSGGGTTGQAGAIVLGIARALQVRNPDLHHHLSEGGYLTRDSRMVERKKYGYKKARRSFQFSKR